MTQTDAPDRRQRREHRGAPWRPSGAHRRAGGGAVPVAGPLRVGATAPTAARRSPTSPGSAASTSHRQTFTIEADHPEMFASEDNGATPPEIVLGALASCLTAGVATVATEPRRAAALGDGDASSAGMDLQGILGIDGDVRNGFDAIDVTYDIDADASRDDIEAIVAQSQKRSAVFDIVTNPTTVRVVAGLTATGRTDRRCAPPSWSSAPVRAGSR